MRRTQAAEEVLGRYGFSYQVEPTPARRRADHQLLMQRGTDWQFLRRLARRNGYCCYFEYNSDQGEVVGYFKPRAIGATPQADLTILREGQNLKWVDLQLVMTGPVRHFGAAIDPILKRIVRASVIYSTIGRTTADYKTCSRKRKVRLKHFSIVLKTHRQCRQPPKMLRRLRQYTCSTTDCIC